MYWLTLVGFTTACRPTPRTCDAEVAQFIAWAERRLAQSAQTPRSPSYGAHPSEAATLPQLDLAHPLPAAPHYGREVTLAAHPGALEVGRGPGPTLLIAAADVSAMAVAQQIERLGPLVDVLIRQGPPATEPVAPPVGLEQFWEAFDTVYPHDQLQPMVPAGDLPPKPLRQAVMHIRTQITRHPDCPVDFSRVRDASLRDQGAVAIQVWAGALQDCDCRMDVDAIGHRHGCLGQ